MLGAKTFYFTPPGREDISIVLKAIMVGRFSAYFDIKEAEVKIESSQKFKFQKVKDPPNFPARATLNPHILGHSRMKEGAVCVPPNITEAWARHQHQGQDEHQERRDGVDPDKPPQQASMDGVDARLAEEQQVG